MRIQRYTVPKETPVTKKNCGHLVLYEDAKNAVQRVQVQAFKRISELSAEIERMKGNE